MARLFPAPLNLPHHQYYTALLPSSSTTAVTHSDTTSPTDESLGLVARPLHHLSLAIRGSLTIYPACAQRARWSVAFAITSQIHATSEDPLRTRVGLESVMIEWRKWDSTPYCGKHREPSCSITKGYSWTPSRWNGNAATVYPNTSLLP